MIFTKPEENRHERVLASFSKNLYTSEQNYTTNDCHLIDFLEDFIAILKNLYLKLFV